MPISKFSIMHTKPIPINIMDLRDDAFYDFIRQFSGKKVAELLAFQECNGVDSFLGCEDVTAILQLKSEQLNDLKKNTCIILSDGSAVLLPGLESSINNLKKILKKKREELNKQSERLHSINSSILSATNTTIMAPTPTIPSLLDPLTCTSSHTHLLSDSQGPFNSLTKQIKDRITRTIIDWLEKNKHELNLLNTNLREGIDFQLALNKREDGILMICKCGTKNSIGQKQGTLVVRN